MSTPSKTGFYKAQLILQLDCTYLYVNINDDVMVKFERFLKIKESLCKFCIPPAGNCSTSSFFESDSLKSMNARRKSDLFYSPICFFFFRPYGTKCLISSFLSSPLFLPLTSSPLCTSSLGEGLLRKQRIAYIDHLICLL